MVPVLRTEEKGSDVNLATYLLFDSFKEPSVFDQAIVISNDSDLVEPIRLVQNECGKRVMVLNPHAGRKGSRVSYHLQQVAAEVRPIYPAAVRNSQFSSVLTDATGHFGKPPSW